MNNAFNNLPELFTCKLAAVEKIDYENGTLLLAKDIYNNTTYKQKFILWILEKYFTEFEYLDIKEVYQKSLNEWITYNKSKNEFIALIMSLVITYGKNTLTKTKHLDIIRIL